MMHRKQPSAGVLAVGIFLLAGATPGMAQNVDEETARIQTVIQSITTHVDLRRFDLLARFYAEVIIADYSSLWGTPPRTLTRSEIGSAWAGFIPGFDTTRHDISNIEVQIDGHQANARADVTALHWLDGDNWTISGTYTFDLTKNADDWVVSRWKFVLESESGDRALVDEAEARARQLAM